MNFRRIVILQKEIFGHGKNVDYFHQICPGFDPAPSAVSPADTDESLKNQS
jgi:hypothetical protein